MLKNYFKVAIRNLLNQKLYSFITIFGLAFGMACFLLIYSYIQFENSYDDFHKNAKNIYRVDRVYKSKEYTINDSKTGTALAPLLIDNFPPVKNEVRFANLLLCMVNSGEDAYIEKRFLFTDSSVFSVFTFPLKIGNPKTALVNPFSVVITPQTVLKYFGNKNPIGQKIYFQMRGLPKKYSFTVTGITNDIPSNSTIKFDFLASFVSLNNIMGDKLEKSKWSAGPVWTYIQLQNNYDPNKLETLFPSFVKKYVPKGDVDITDYKLIPLRDSYYEKGDGMPFVDWGIKPFSYLLLLMTILVLIIACINYTNLLSAHSITRAKEIGVRKVQGANRLQIILQFIGESVIVSLLSFLFAMVLVELLLPSFRSILGDAFSFGILAKREVNFNIMYPRMLGYMFIISIVVGIVSGFYPAIVLSRFNAAHVIKGELRAGKSSAWIRRILVVTQFAVSVIFIICSLHVLWQIHYWKNANLGFNKDNMICIPVYDNEVKDKYELFKNKLLQNSNISDVTSSSVIPGGLDNHIIYLSSGNVKNLSATIYDVDQDFINTMGLKIEGGRNFSNTISSDSKSAIIMNQAAMKACGWNEVKGQEIQLYTDANDKASLKYSGNLIGEIKDFNYRFDKPADDPLILKIEPKGMLYILIRINNSNPGKAIEYIKSSWKDMRFEQAFHYSYLSNEIASSFSIFEVIDTFIRFAALITIVIAILGLFALATFIIDRKTKEIGIRKVMGASVKEIVFKLSRSFILLVVIAEIIAVPISYKLVSFMLQGLPNHIMLNVWLFISASMFVIILSFAVVGIKSFIAATANPVKSLRYE
ncbi:MAG: ABC transporter permease [Bacteroidetes bacterium]|nr:ABC transporter permease [Bacteroidota bacterium]